MANKLIYSQVMCIILRYLQHKNECYPLKQMASVFVVGHKERLASSYCVLGKLAVVRLAGLDNLGKGWFEGSAANQETIDVRLLDQVLCVFVVHGSAVDDSDLLGNALRNVRSDPGPN